MLKRLTVAFLVFALAFAGNVTAQDKPQGFVLKIGTTEDLDSISVFNAYERAATELFLLVYDPLVSFDENLKPIPALAESWSVSPDGLEWTFKLRKGVKWSDGTPFTSADVKFTYEATMGSGLGLYESSLEGIKEIETPDDLTVVLHTEEPKANMLQNPTPILPKHIWEAAKGDYETFEDGALVGTGAFRFHEWKKNEYISLSANPEYYGGKPEVGAVIFTIFANRDTLARSLESGEIDVALNLYPDQVAALEKSGTIDILQFSANGFTQLAANSWTASESKGNPVLRDARVRQAIDYAMDKKEILSVALGGSGTIGTTLIPECIPEWHYRLPEGKERSYDPAAAKNLLSSAGCVDTDGDGVREDPSGKKLNLRFLVRSDNTREVKAGQMIQAYLKDVGIATTLSTVDDGALQDAIDSSDYDLFIWGWGGAVDPTPLLAILMTDQIDGNNEPRWSDPAYDELVKRQAALIDNKERQAAVFEAQRLAYEAAPYILLAYDGDIQAMRKDRVKGWVRINGNGPVFYADTNYNYLHVAQAATASSGGSRTAVYVVALAVVAAIVLALVLRRKPKKA